MDISDQDSACVSWVKEFDHVQDITFAHKLVKDFAEDLEEAVVLNFSLMEKVVSFEEGPEVSQVALIDLDANLINHLINFLEVALSVDNWLLYIVCSFFENSKVSIVERINEINCGNFTVEVAVESIHNWLELGRYVELDTC